MKARKKVDIESKSSHELVLHVRSQQFYIHNEFYGSKGVIPVHFAFGHEAIAAAVATSMDKKDEILLTHRNIHYQLAFGEKSKKIIDEFLLNPSGVNQGKFGSMNFVNKKYKVVYTSNILGNNLAVATGVALANKVRKIRSVTWCTSGDGAIEEGAFYESVLNSVALDLPIIYLVENNRWSLASEIIERRKELSLSYLAKALGAFHLELYSNNVVEYKKKLKTYRKKVLTRKKPLIVEIHLETLGGYLVKDPKKRYVNYHAGKVKPDLLSKSVIKKSFKDPVWVSAKKIN